MSAGRSFTRSPVRDTRLWCSRARRAAAACPDGSSTATCAIAPRSAGPQKAWTRSATRPRSSASGAHGAKSSTRSTSAASSNVIDVCQRAWPRAAGLHLVFPGAAAVRSPHPARGQRLSADQSRRTRDRARARPRVAADRLDVSGRHLRARALQPRATWSAGSSAIISRDGCRASSAPTACGRSPMSTTWRRRTSRR